MKTYFKAVLLLFAFVLFSCDKDFNTLGSDIIGDEHFNFEKYNAENLNSYIKATGPIQTNNLPINALGIYNNSVFGTTKAHFVSQIEMVSPNPTLNYNHYYDSVKDSVYIYVPYFSTYQSTDTNGNNTYELDSIYGDLDAKFNLKVYENGYALREFDPTDNNNKQKYYSNKVDVESYKGSVLLNNSSNTSENSQFFFNRSEIIIYKTNGNGQYVNSSGGVTNNPDEYVVKERKKPGIWLNLKKDFFQSKIDEAFTNGHLYNNNVFKQFFKGLYFKVEENNPNQGALAQLDFSAAELIVQYHYYSTATETNPDNALKSFLKFQMGYAGSKANISINLLELTNINTDYSNALLPSATQEKLYLKGGVNGSVVYIDVFNDSELQTLRDNNWLINDANLVFYIDQSSMANADYEPQRVYLFDATNNKPLLDYYADVSVSTSIKYNKYIHGGIIQKDSDGKGIKYKIRITDYINNVLNGTNPNNNGNSRLGLVVTESINIATNASLKTPIQFGTPSDETKSIPVASVINPLGTILYGAQSSDPDKKLKLEIYYTKPN